MKYRMATLMAGCALALPVPALAQVAAEATETRDAGQSNEAADAADNGDIVVTANRREERLLRVPISVAAYTQERLDEQGVKRIDDIARITPNVQFERSAFGSGSRTDISIRGISSTVGAATTGVYVDDAPVQVRQIGSSQIVATPFPRLFDLERVEVLRGPQGTLFGAGAQGGAVRFITPAASVTNWSGYARAEAAATRFGAASGEFGLAVGGPIVEEKLGFRVSAWSRRDGGFVDRIDYFTGDRLDRNANREGAFVARAALKWVPFEGVTVEPSFLYQKTTSRDTGTFWQQFSNPKLGRLFNANIAPSPYEGRFYLPALKIAADVGAVTLTSATSYFNNKTLARPDYTQYNNGILFPYLGEDASFYPYFPGVSSASLNDDRQKTFSQEVRAQSNGDGPLSWTIGAFYSHADASTQQMVELGATDLIIRQVYGIGIEDFFGGPLYEGYPFFARTNSIDKQFAIFGQADYAVTDRLKLTVGGRIAKTSFSFDDQSRGSFTGTGTDSSGRQSERPFTPKVGLNFQADPDNLFYVSATKGYRVGGSQARLPDAVCGADLEQLGLDTSPTQYSSDSVWSYELGAKNNLLGGRVKLETSAFYINWKNIQTSVFLESCGMTFIANLGSATSKGGDISAQIGLTDDLRFDIAVGYTDARFDKTIRSGNVLLVADGDYVVRSPWSVSASMNYRRDVFGREGFARIDYQYNSRHRDQNLDVFGVDPGIPSRPPVEVVNMRVGLDVGVGQVSLFANNLFDARPNFITRDFQGSPLYLGSTLRPRTIGVALERRF